MYGFGKWIDQTFDFSSQTLTCLYGENEAGKSTLQQFIIYMLFGFPPKLRTLYKPKQSNRFGGTMTIKDDEIGTYTIERVDADVTCFLPNGETAGDDWLQTQLNGLTKEIYESIYSFSALDLSTIRQMKANELSEVLFSVGLTGATSIYEVEKQLEKQIGDLFKKTGRLPLINKQLKKVSEMQQKLHANKALEKSYEKKISEKETLEEQIVATQKELRLVKEKLLQAEKIKQLIPVLKQYQLLEGKLQQLPESISFPENGLRRYESLKQSLLPLQSEWQMIDQNVKEQEEKIRVLSESLHEEAIVMDAQALVQQSRDVQVRAEKMLHLEKDLASMNDTIARLLRSTHLLEAQLEEIVLPFHVEKSWQVLSDTNVQLQQESEQLTDDHQILTEQSGRLVEEASVIHEQLMSKEALQRAEEQVQGFRVQQVKEQWTAWQENRNKINRRVLWTTTILAVITFVFALYTDNNVLIIVPVILLLVGVGQLYLSKISLKDMTDVETGPGINLTNEERDQINRQLAKQRELEAALQVVNSEQKRINNQQLQLEERTRLFIKKENKWMNEINQEKQQYSFLQNIEPAYWVEFLETIRNAKQILSEKREIEMQLEDLQSDHQQFQTMLSEFAANINMEVPINIEHVEKMIDQQRSDVQLLEQYRQMLTVNLNKQKELTGQINIYENEMNQLFIKAEVENEEQYFERANRLKEKKELLNQKENLVQQLLLTVPETELEKVLKEVIDDNEKTIHILELTDEKQRLEDYLEMDHQQIAAIKLEINQLETTESISQTAYLFEMEKDKLNELARRWAMLKAAQTALIKAKDTYQEKYVHEVIHKTSTYFKRLTKGKYTSVFAPTESELFQVEANNDIRYTVDELSQGTIDQLYVSLRLAIGQVMSDKFVVPFIIDDAFVHFDEGRTKEIIQLLKEIAKKHDQQILLFTCKRYIAQRFDQTAMKELLTV